MLASETASSSTFKMIFQFGPRAFTQSNDRGASTAVIRGHFPLINFEGEGVYIDFLPVSLKIAPRNVYRDGHVYLHCHGGICVSSTKGVA